MLCARGCAQGSRDPGAGPIDLQFPSTNREHVQIDLRHIAKKEGRKLGRKTEERLKRTTWRGRTQGRRHGAVRQRNDTTAAGCAHLPGGRLRPFAGVWQRGFLITRGGGRARGRTNTVKSRQTKHIVRVRTIKFELIPGPVVLPNNRTSTQTRTTDRMYRNTSKLGVWGSGGPGRAPSQHQTHPHPPNQSIRH